MRKWDLRSSCDGPCFPEKYKPQKGRTFAESEANRNQHGNKSEHDTPPAQSHPSLEVLDHNSMFTLKPNTIDEVNSLGKGSKKKNH